MCRPIDTLQVLNLSATFNNNVVRSDPPVLLVPMPTGDPSFVVPDGPPVRIARYELTYEKREDVHTLVASLI